MQTARSAELKRKTKETDISISLAIDGEGRNDITTGFGFLDHMLDLCAFWAGMDLELHCTGDLNVDAHHTAEDIGIPGGDARRGRHDARDPERGAPPRRRAADA